MVGVPQDDREFQIAQLALFDSLDGALRSDRHEHRRVDRAVVRMNHPGPRTGGGIGGNVFKSHQCAARARRSG